MRKVIGTCIAFVATVLGFAAPATAAPAPAPSGLQFSYIRFDAPGKDTKHNVNGEVVRITNRSAKTVVMTGYTLSDVRTRTGKVHRFTFPKFTLAAGKTVYVHSGKGTNGMRRDGVTRDARQLYAGNAWHIWNNNGDRATLRDAAGKVVDRCGFGYHTHRPFTRCN